MAAHYSLIHSNDQTAWLSTRRICPITTLPFLTLITRQMTWNLPFHPQCEWLLKSMISCGVTIWMKHLWWHFHIALFIFQREIWKCCWLIFLILVTIETNPVIKFKYFKTGNSGPWKHFKLFDLERNYIMYMLWFNFILDLYIFNNNCFKLMTMPLSFITIPPKNKRKIIKCKPWTTTFTFFTTLIFNVTLSLFSDSHSWILE